MILLCANYVKANFPKDFTRLGLLEKPLDVFHNLGASSTADPIDIKEDAIPRSLVPPRDLNPGLSDEQRVDFRALSSGPPRTCAQPSALSPLDDARDQNHARFSTGLQRRNHCARCTPGVRTFLGASLPMCRTRSCLTSDGFPRSNCGQQRIWSQTTSLLRCPSVSQLTPHTYHRHPPPGPPAR